MSKLAVKVMRDRNTPDLSFDTPRPKFDLILWPGWVNPSHKFDDDNLSFNYDQICDMDSPILAII